MERLPCIGLYKPSINLPFGDCAIKWESSPNRDDSQPMIPKSDGFFWIYPHGKRKYIFQTIYLYLEDHPIYLEDHTKWPKWLINGGY